MDYQTQYHEYKALADAALNTYFTDTAVSYHRLLEAMHYSLTAGGKRLRPVLVLDALQAEAFRTILSAELPADVRAESARLLAEAAGENGICGGQQLDMEGEGKVLTKEELMDINDRKTSAMIYAACLMGVTCGGGDAQQRAAAAQYARALGLAFQIRDDMLDVISTEAELGKPIGSDAREGKNTFMALYGLERCSAYVHELSEEAAAVVDGAFADSAFLQQLARSLADRKN